MIKTRSKSKIKTSTVFVKKQAEDKHKKLSKEVIKKIQDKQNTANSVKLSMTVAHSKKKLKQSGQDSSRAISPLCLNKRKNEQAKTDDQKFIEKLFSQTLQNNNGKQKQKRSKKFFVQNLIQNLVPEQTVDLINKNHNGSHYESTDLLKQLHMKNQQNSMLHQQIQQLKLYVSNFTFKVFDLTVLCRKLSGKFGCQDENMEFTKKTDEVIAYLDSLIRHWKLQDKIKLHCEHISKKLYSLNSNRVNESRKRCHTESLKIPIQQYLQSLQNTNKMIKEEISKEKQENDSDQLMKILSRRSSGLRKQEEQIYVAIKGYISQNEHQLDIKPGQRITIIQKNANQKWLGIKDNKLGYFPKDCLF